MAGRGPAPNPDDARVAHDRPDAPDPVEVSAGSWLGQTGTLPEYPGEGWWHPETVKWFRMWTEVPWAHLFGPTDWAAIGEAAILHDKLMRGVVSVAGELRLRTANLGYTITDRQRLRLKLRPEGKPASQEPVKPGEAGVVSMSDRRSRMGLGTSTEH